MIYSSLNDSFIIENYLTVECYVAILLNNLADLLDNLPLNIRIQMYILHDS